MRPPHALHMLRDDISDGAPGCSTMRLLTLLGSAAIGSVAATQGALRLARTAVTVGFEMAAGDLAEQHIEQRSAIRPFRWDRERSRRLGLTGLCTTGPLAHTLFEGLESMVPGTAVKSVLTKVVLNAAFMPVMISATLGTALLLEGRTLRQVRTNLETQLIPSVLAGLAFWPPANCFVYKFIAPPLRPAISSGFGGIWGIYLSARANEPGHYE